VVITFTEDDGNGFCLGESFGITRKETMTRIEVERSGFFNRWRTVNRGGKVREVGKLQLHDFFWRGPSLILCPRPRRISRRSRACEAGRPGINRGDPLQVGRRLFMPEALTLDGRRAGAIPPEALLAEVTFKRLQGLRGRRYGNPRFPSRKVGSRRLGLSRENTDSGLRNGVSC
jgi:hypothetical protein